MTLLLAYCFGARPLFAKAGRFFDSFSLIPYALSEYCGYRDLGAKARGLSLNDSEKYFSEVGFSRLEAASTPRELFNELTRLRFVTQWTSDQRYMVDLGRIDGTQMWLPFYDDELVEFSAKIPYELAVGARSGHAGYSEEQVTIRKALLRDAFSEEIAPLALNRKKAVSPNNELQFSGRLGRVVRDVLADDLAQGDLCSRLGAVGLARTWVDAQGFSRHGNEYWLRFLVLAYLSVLDRYRPAIQFTGSFKWEHKRASG
ncbi:MAG: asparagine synthase-related protein [Polyangiaceae bacterium]|nr:asparagine synthase-related protein [Polyangiaceae bacterium]